MPFQGRGAGQNGFRGSKKSCGDGWPRRRSDFFFFRAEHVSVWFSICSISIVEYFNFHANSHLIVFLLFFGVLYDHLLSNYYEKYTGSHVSISDV